MLGSGVVAPAYKFVGPTIELFCLSGEMVRHFLKDEFDRHTKPDDSNDFIMKLFKYSKFSQTN